MPKNSYQIKISDRDIDIELQYAVKKRLTLTVYPDKRVIARIPFGMPKHSVENYVQNKSKWLLKHLEHFDQHPPENEKHYQDGESFSLLGKTLKLSVQEGKNRVELKGDHIILQVKDTLDRKQKERVLNAWYRKQAIEIITPMYRDWTERLQYLNLPITTLRFYKMKRRWGSCSSKGVITLNIELIKKDPKLIDYVIVHEICHLKVPAHNKAFWDLVGSIIPDWKKKRKALQ